MTKEEANILVEKCINDACWTYCHSIKVDAECGYEVMDEYPNFYMVVVEMEKGEYCDDVDGVINHYLINEVNKYVDNKAFVYAFVEVKDSTNCRASIAVPLDIELEEEK